MTEAEAFAIFWNTGDSQLDETFPHMRAIAQRAFNAGATWGVIEFSDRAQAAVNSVFNINVRELQDK